MRLFWWLCWLLPMTAVALDDPSQLAYPVLDAKQAVADGNIEFVGIQLQDELITPGLTPAQRNELEQQYPIRALNRRWKTFDNIEEDKTLLQNYRAYALKYNLTLLEQMRLHKRRQLQKYRY
ncbi:hypothetical protein CHH28_15970 [Bacterioplanes sanyensis]|uniref:Uncharacterized protein n=1 Tax=Bacterioplanes sanyensis TaxID=1249553 RepID=A0A222FMS5_9GAMM|nr:hypothetical protein [Bacterioplanes sanyensis]ASP40080.1 hypothetical protein CHH28_15970 [Bacterioplanes sanyensis]